jgi:hypothetical protein
MGRRAFVGRALTMSNCSSGKCKGLIRGWVALLLMTLRVSPCTLEEACALANGWHQRDKGTIAKLRAIKNRLAALKSAKFVLRGRYPYMGNWLSLQDKLP